MSYDFKGDLENINQRQIEFISEVLRKQKYIGTEVFVENFAKKGDNYGSQVKRIKVQFENGKEFKMIAKILPDVLKGQTYSTISDIFMNEAIIFNEVLPKFKELQEKFGLPEEDLFKYPFCYGAVYEKDNEIILLEDLVVSNFTMLDKTKPLNNETVKLVLKNVANFHSMSYVLRDKEPQTLKKILESLVNPLFNEKNKVQTEIFFEQSLNYMKTSFNTSKYKNIIFNIMQDLSKPRTKLNAHDKESKYTIVLHGDLWTNNIMFQIKDNQPASCTFLDYQMSQDGVPVSDIHYFTFNCTDYETRSKHYHEWIDYYHSELDRYLNYFGLKANYVYPRDKFDADLKRYGKAAIGTAFFVLNITMREAEEAGGLVATENANGTELIAEFKMGTLRDKTYETIKERIEGLIESAYEYGYINKNLLN